MCRIRDLDCRLLQKNGQCPTFCVNLPISQRVLPPRHTGETGTQRGELLKAKAPLKPGAPVSLITEKAHQCSRPHLDIIKQLGANAVSGFQADQDSADLYASDTPR